MSEHTKAVLNLGRKHFLPKLEHGEEKPSGPHVLYPVSYCAPTEEPQDPSPTKCITKGCEGKTVWEVCLCLCPCQRLLKELLLQTEFQATGKPAHHFAISSIAFL